MALYFSFGSNLNKSQMQRRCPAAEPVGKFTLLDSRLVFRGYADSIHEFGAKCHGALWRITPACEEALDRYEGVHGGHYRKEYVPLADDNEYGDTHLMLYVMNSDGIFPPPAHYLETIAQGYRDFKLPMDALKEAVAHSHDHRQPSQRELTRHHKQGRPKLAPRPDGLPMPKRTKTETRYRNELPLDHPAPTLGKWRGDITAWDRRAQKQLDAPQTSWDEWQSRKYPSLDDYDGGNGVVDLFDDGWGGPAERKTKRIRRAR